MKKWSKRVITMGSVFLSIGMIITASSTAVGNFRSYNTNTATIEKVDPGTMETYIIESPIPIDAPAPPEISVAGSDVSYGSENYSSLIIPNISEIKKIECDINATNVSIIAREPGVGKFVYYKGEVIQEHKDEGIIYVYNMSREFLDNVSVDGDTLRINSAGIFGEYVYVYLPTETLEKITVSSSFSTINIDGFAITDDLTVSSNDSEISLKNIGCWELDLDTTFKNVRLDNVRTSSETKLNANDTWVTVNNSHFNNLQLDSSLSTIQMNNTSVLGKSVVNSQNCDIAVNLIESSDSYSFANENSEYNFTVNGSHILGNKKKPNANNTFEIYSDGISNILFTTSGNAPAYVIN